MVSVSKRKDINENEKLSFFIDSVSLFMNSREKGLSLDSDHLLGFYEVIDKGCGL